MFLLTGLRAVEVSARTFRQGGIDLHDAATVSFDNGAIGSLFGGASVPEERRARLRLSIAGEKGILDLDIDLDRCQMHLHDGTSRKLQLAEGDWTYSCVGPVRALIDLALGHGENLSSADIGARSIELLDAILRSAKTGGAAVAIGRRQRD
jgi:predicted dehydrogenase